MEKSSPTLEEKRLKAPILMQMPYSVSFDVEKLPC
jgi:hypothetical protein